MLSERSLPVAIWPPSSRTRATSLGLANRLADDNTDRSVWPAHCGAHLMIIYSGPVLRYVSRPAGPEAAHKRLDGGQKGERARSAAIND